MVGPAEKVLKVLTDLLWSLVSIGLNCKLIQDDGILKGREVSLFLEAHCFKLRQSAALRIFTLQEKAGVVVVLSYNILYVYDI